jgi:hypothetical protein
MTLANWRDLAVVLIAIEVFILCLVPGVILYFIVRGLSWLIAQVRHYGPLVRARFAYVAELAERYSHKPVEPILQAHELRAKVPRMGEVAVSSFSKVFEKQEVSQ